MTSFLGNFTDSHYYDGRYAGAFTQPTADFGKIQSYFNANVNNSSSFMQDPAATAQNQYPNNFDLIERVTAGYLMNTLQFGQVRLQTGVRFEGTQENLLGIRFSLTPTVFCARDRRRLIPFARALPTRSER